jgi:Fe-S-cluster containining protein
MVQNNLFQNFPDYVPEKTCLACQGCCRFNATNSQWRPKISEEEIDAVHQESAFGKKIFRGTVDHEHFLQTFDIPKVQPYSAQCQCTFFDIENNRCKIYKQRPFDCRLYPFLLVKKDNAYFVGVHLNCPYIEKTRHEVPFTEQVEKVKKFFEQQHVLEYFKRNKLLAGEYADYQHEIDCLFKIDIT